MAKKVGLPRGAQERRREVCTSMLGIVWGWEAGGLHLQWGSSWGWEAGGLHRHVRASSGDGLAAPRLGLHFPSSHNLPDTPTPHPACQSAVALGTGGCISTSRRQHPPTSPTPQLPHPTCQMAVGLPAAAPVCICTSPSLIQSPVLSSWVHAPSFVRLFAPIATGPDPSSAALTSRPCPTPLSL